MKLSEVVKKARESSSKKKLQYLVIFIIVAVILCIYFSTYLTEGKSQAGLAANSAGAQSDIEEKLKTVLSKVDGAGRVDVIINYESTAELVPALSEDSQTSVSEGDGKSSTTSSEKKDIATVQGNSEVLIIKENQPEVRGVIIVAEGAENIGVKMDLLNAVTTLLNVEPSKVEILKMNKS